MARILLIDDDPDVTALLQSVLEEKGYRVTSLEQAEEAALAEVSSGQFDLLLLDNILQGRLGIGFLEDVRRRGLSIPVIMMTGHGTSDVAIEAWRWGVFDYVEKPMPIDDPFCNKLLQLIRKAVEAGQFMNEPVLLQGEGVEEGTLKPALLGRSERLQEVIKLIGQVANPKDPVLIYGETGTGKELVARALFHHSDRKGSPFLAVRCAAFQEDQVDKELFGQEQGFAGTEGRGVGALEKADGGAVLLDEIGELSLSAQCRLLRFLEEGQFTRPGGSAVVRPNVRIIATTSRDLEATGEDKFRKALYYRLGIPIRLPLLRDRGDDVLLLADHFLKQAAEAKPTVRSFHPQAQERLRKHHWPGNVRELADTVRHAVLVCVGSQILAEDLRLDPLTASGEGEILTLIRRAVHAAVGSGQDNLAPRLNEMLERELVRRAWLDSGGDVDRVAKCTGLSPEDVWKQLYAPGSSSPEIPLQGGTPKPSPPKKRLPPSREKAYQLYKWATEVSPELAGKSDAEVFHWLQTDPRVAGEGLPRNVETFKKFLRDARRYYDDHKHAPPGSTKSPGGSIVPRDKI
jgi:two-component system response regulator AtoC